MPLTFYVSKKKEYDDRDRNFTSVPFTYVRVCVKTAISKINLVHRRQHASPQPY